MKLNIEVIGLVSTLLVLLSFLLKSEQAIRRVNILGAAGFVIYGAGLGATSVWLLNGTLIFIHLIRLVQLRKANLRNQNTLQNVTYYHKGKCVSIKEKRIHL